MPYCTWEHPLTTVVELLLPVAAQELRNLGIDTAKRYRYLRCRKDRVEKRQTGAKWQLNQFERLSNKTGRDPALREMLAHYAVQRSRNIPVADWSYR